MNLVPESLVAKLESASSLQQGRGTSDRPPANVGPEQRGVVQQVLELDDKSAQQFSILQRVVSSRSSAAWRCTTYAARLLLRARPSLALPSLLQNPHLPSFLVALPSMVTPYRAERIRLINENVGLRSLRVDVLTRSSRLARAVGVREGGARHAGRGRRVSCWVAVGKVQEGSGEGVRL